MEVGKINKSVSASKHLTLRLPSGVEQKLMAQDGRRSGKLPVAGRSASG